mmetsp:Transcript_3680/g.7595  ORF Transcript_3680/g.7595 Transcript_3680/m.7595 type:complete len:231 (-) Transcript_3680:57-749(-)
MQQSCCWRRKPWAEAGPEGGAGAGHLSGSPCGARLRRAPVGVAAVALAPGSTCPPRSVHTRASSAGPVRDSRRVLRSQWARHRQGGAASAGLWDVHQGASSLQAFSFHADLPLGTLLRRPPAPPSAGLGGFRWVHWRRGPRWPTDRWLLETSIRLRDSRGSRCHEHRAGMQTRPRSHRQNGLPSRLRSVFRKRFGAQRMGGRGGDQRLGRCLLSSLRLQRAGGPSGAAGA